MKYRYRLIIEDTKENQKILEVAETGTTRSQKTCLKSIRREINSTIKEMLDKIDSEEHPEKE